MSRPARIALKVAVWGLGLAPLAALGYWVVSADLTANPISFVTKHLGDWTFRILLASLAMTPIRILSGWGWPALLRRLLGLFAFTYALLHFSVWILLDHFFNWGQMLGDIVKRPYITVGMAALLLMVPLAATSTAAMVKRLGGVKWRRLHRLVYAVGVLAALHFLWLAKVGRREQYVYAAIVALLLAIRLGDWVRRRVRAHRSRAAASTERSQAAIHSGSPRPSDGLRLRTSTIISPLASPVERAAARTATSGHPRSEPADERSQAASLSGHPRPEPTPGHPLQRSQAAPLSGHPRPEPAPGHPLQRSQAAPLSGHPRPEPTPGHPLQ